MNSEWDKRNALVIKVLKSVQWPLIRFFFRLKVYGTENINPVKDGPCLYISNHNVGALIESHSSLFIIQEKLGNKSIVYGFTHPSIFKVPLMKQYFEYIGAVPATYPVAEEVFKNSNSLMIFPGGNAQALRSVWDYKNNSFRSTHGWAKIAMKHNVPVVPVSFKGSHFANIVFFSTEWFSKILILPWILGIRVMPFSLGQVIVAGIVYWLSTLAGLPIWAAGILSYIAFVLSVLTIILPVNVSMTIHPAIRAQSQDELEDKVDAIMKKIYQ